jgi:predicted SAM-dependent methyltransferase
MTKLPYLNLGCGDAYDPRWSNIDFISIGPDVQAADLRKGIPFEDGSFTVVYHSHVLEHFPTDEAPRFLGECFRVLAPGGVIRVAIPDLEQIVINYKRCLDDAISSTPGAKEKYEWMMLELVDQMVRTESGGEMLKYIVDTSKNSDRFLVHRCGSEVTRLFETARASSGGETTRHSTERASLYRRAARKLKQKTIEMLLGDEYPLLEVSRFRGGGELHRWMYDRFSLSELLKGCGFRNPIVRTAFDSAIPDWSEFRLDGENGIVRKPDSLFMEAVR